MDDNATKLEYKVGAFVGFGLILAAASILIFGGNRISFGGDLRTVAYFDEVQGLFPGSVVSLAGLPVGNVKAIEFEPGENKLRIEMSIENRFAKRIVEGTTADMRTQGALGDKFVYLAPGAPGRKPVAQHSVLPVNDSGDIMKMLTSKEDGIGQVLGLIKELRALTASLNANGRTTGALDGANAAISQMKTTLAQIDGLVRDVRGQPNDKTLRRALVSLSNVLEKIDQGKGTLGALINDPSVHQRLKAILGGSQRNDYIKDMIRESIHQNESSGSPSK